jgi:hypothetical protein
MFNRGSSSGAKAGREDFYGSIGKVLQLVQGAYRKFKCDEWNYALLMESDSRRKMCPETIQALHDLMSSSSFKNMFSVRTSLDDIKAFIQFNPSAGPIETQAFCMICARALFECQRFFDSLEFTYQALRLVLVDVDGAFPRWTRPVFDKIADNFRTLWALCRVTQVSAFAENVTTTKLGAPDQFVDITAEMFRLTDGDIMKKCTPAAHARTSNADGGEDVELDTLWPIIPMYIIWIEHFFRVKDIKKISAALPKFGKSRHRFTSDLGLTPGVRVRDPGGEIEPFHMYPFEKESSGQIRDDRYFQWFDMARLNYLMTKFSVLMQQPIKGVPFSVALDIFPKAGQSQDCLQGFYGNYELFGAPISRLFRPRQHVALPQVP